VLILKAMIFGILNFLKLQLNTYISGDDRPTAEPLIVLGNPWTNGESGKGASFLNAISLISIEEEKVFKAQSQQYIPRENGRFAIKAPDVKLNLYLLISAYNKNYEDGLKFISKVVAYFQVNNVFDKNGSNPTFSDAMPDDVDRIVMELYTATFEQQNQIWASLSTGYIPSVIYKVKSVIVDADLEKENEAYRNIQTIRVSAKEFNAPKPQ
jgi:hypothetical protein